MSMLDGFAIVVLLVILLSAVAVIVVLGELPGRIALRRNHPQLEAVRIAGWIGLIFVVLWPLALIWAYLDVPAAAAHSEAGLLHRTALDDVTARREAAR
jgi:uncharacterized BrkB/YihY/UPF0761 family membrane protein